ncbi:MAG: Ig-like domain-containing protein [Candidatus Woykebacteria bacterium]
MDKTKRIIILTAFGFSLGLVIIGILLVPKPKEVPTGRGKTQEELPKVVSVEPLVDQTGISVTPQITVNFDSSIAGKEVSIESKPAVKFTLGLDLAGTKATFSLQSNLKPGAKYEFKVKYESKTLFMWNATTKSKGTSQTNLYSAMNNVRSKLPLVGSGYRISYDAGTDQFFVFVEKAPLATYKGRANGWFAQQDVADLATLNINYVAKGSLR